MSLKEAVASKPPNGSAKVITVESEEMVAFGNVYLRKEDFGLSVVLRLGPLVVPRFKAMLFADLFDVREGYGGGKKVWVCGRGDVGSGEECALLSKVISSFIAFLARVSFDPVESYFVGFVK